MVTWKSIGIVAKWLIYTYLRVTELACADHLHLVVDPWNFLHFKTHGSEGKGISDLIFEIWQHRELLEETAIPRTSLRFPVILCCWSVGSFEYSLNFVKGVITIRILMPIVLFPLEYRLNCWKSYLGYLRQWIKITVIFFTSVWLWLYETEKQPIFKWSGCIVPSFGGKLWFVSKDLSKCGTTSFSFGRCPSWV